VPVTSVIFRLAFTKSKSPSDSGKMLRALNAESYSGTRVRVSPHTGDNPAKRDRDAGLILMSLTLRSDVARSGRNCAAPPGLGFSLCKSLPKTLK
jgi:hypothetical protein